MQATLVEEKLTKKEIRDFFWEKAKENNIEEGWAFGFCNGYKRVGYCNHKKKRVMVSEELIENGTNEQIKNTVLHELAHALLPNTVKHGYQWKALFIKIGGNGQRAHAYKLGAPVNYLLCCSNGCFKQPYMRKPSLNLKRYKCRKCGSGELQILKKVD